MLPPRSYDEVSMGAFEFKSGQAYMRSCLLDRHSSNGGK